MLEATPIPASAARRDEPLHNLAGHRVNVIDGSQVYGVALADVAKAASYNELQAKLQQVGTPSAYYLNPAVPSNHLNPAIEVNMQSDFNLPRPPQPQPSVQPANAANGRSLRGLFDNTVPESPAAQAVGNDPPLAALLEVDGTTYAVRYHDAIETPGALVLVYATGYPGERSLPVEVDLKNLLVIPSRRVGFELIVTGVAFAHNGYDYVIYAIDRKVEFTDAQLQALNTGG